MARLRPEQLAELRRLHDEAMAFVDWTIRHQDFPSGPATKQLVADAFEKQSLTSMRSIARELRFALGAMTSEVRAAMLDGIKLESGISLAASEGADATDAQAILARGRVRTESEYYLLRGYLDRAEADPALEAEIPRILELLGSYSGPASAAT